MSRPVRSSLLSCPLQKAQRSRQTLPLSKRAASMATPCAHLAQPGFFIGQKPPIKKRRLPRFVSAALRQNGPLKKHLRGQCLPFGWRQSRAENLYCHTLRATCPAQKNAPPRPFGVPSAWLAKNRRGVGVVSAVCPFSLAPCSTCQGFAPPLRALDRPARGALRKWQTSATKRRKST